MLPKILEPTRLQELLAEPANKLLLVDVCSAESHAAGHVPGARHLPPAALVSGQPPAPGLLPDAQRLGQLLAGLALTPDTHVVAMDDEGGGWAGRLLWTLAILGHDNWSYLNGGTRAWAGDGLPLASGIPDPVLLADGPADPALDLQHRCDADYIHSRLGDPGLLVWDCRSAAEYRGERKAAARAGHIPGARHLDWLDLMDPERHLRLRTDLPALLAGAGITPDAEVVVHCQTHHRSGLAWLVAEVLGYPKLRAYDGSWADWGNRPDLPVEV